MEYKKSHATGHSYNIHYVNLKTSTNLKNNSFSTLFTICRYCFKGFITDQSATAPITFFTPAADDLIGYSCAELIAMHNAEDPQQIPSQIFEIEGQNNIFQFHFNETSKITSFVLDQVFDKKRVNQAPLITIQSEPGNTYFFNNLSYLN